MSVRQLSSPFRIRIHLLKHALHDLARRGGHAALQVSNHLRKQPAGCSLFGSRLIQLRKHYVQDPQACFAGAILPRGRYCKDTSTTTIAPAKHRTLPAPSPILKRHPPAYKGMRYVLNRPFSAQACFICLRRPRAPVAPLPSGHAHVHSGLHETQQDLIPL